MTFPNKYVRIYWIIGFIFLIGGLIIIQCSSPKGNPQITEIKIEKSEPQYLKLSQIGNKVDYIKLQPDSNALLNNITKLEIVDDLIFVQCFNMFSPIYVFNLTGKYERSIGIPGRGPNEVSANISDFTIDAKRKIIFMLISNRMILKFNFNGTLLDKIKLESHGSHIALHDNKIYVNYSYPDHFSNNNYAISVYDYSGKQIKQLINFKHFNTTVDEYNRSKRDALGIFQQINDTLVYWEPKIDTVFYIYHQKTYPRYILNRQNEIKSKVRGFVENDRFVFFPYIVFSNTMHTFLFDKITKKGMFLGYQTEDPWKSSKYLLTNDIDNGWPFMPRGLCSNGYLWDYYFDYQLISFRNPTLNLKEIFEKYKNSQSLDNPTIMLVKQTTK